MTQVSLCLHFQVSLCFNQSQISTTIYDKRVDFNFKIINFPNMCSNIPASAYGVYISQLIRYARASRNYSDFFKRHLYLRNRLLDQGYKKIRLIRSVKKFIFRYQDLVEIYSASLCRDNGEWWIFIKWKCIKIRKSTTMSKTFFVNVWRKSVFDIYFRS